MTVLVQPRCSVFIAVSSDGFIAREDGALDWLDRVALDGEDYGYAAFFGSIDTLVVGRKTWEVVYGFDPYPWAGKRVVVMTRQPNEAKQGAKHDEQFTDDGAAAVVARLAAAGARHIYVDGGAVIREFLAAGLIDDLTLSVVPVLLGKGIPLFGGGVERALEHQSTQTWSSGLVQLRYRVKRDTPANSPST